MFHLLFATRPFHGKAQRAKDELRAKDLSAVNAEADPFLSSQADSGNVWPYRGPINSIVYMWRLILFLAVLSCSNVHNGIKV